MRVQIVDPPGVHATVRPRPVRGARARGRRGRAGHEPLRVRAGARGRTGYEVDRALLPPLDRAAASRRPARRGPAARRARARDAPPAHPRSRRGRRPPAVAERPRPRPLPAAQAPAGVHRSTTRCRARGGRVARQRALLDRMDAVIAHSEHGAGELRELLGDPARVHRIPHGAFEHLTDQADERPLPAELAAVEGPVILCFGLVRPYKGVDVLLEAFARDRGRRAVGRRHAADGHGAAAPRSPSAARGRCASSSASSPTRRSPPTSAARTSSRCRTARSSSRASSTRRSRSATPIVASAVGRLHRGRRARRRAAAGAAGSAGAARRRRSRSWSADPAARAELAAAAARAAVGPVLVGGGRRAHARALPPPGRGMIGRW